jgi:hypothetical protein
MGKQWVFEGVPETWQEVEDRLFIAQLDREDIYPDGLSIRFQSWRDDGRDHEVAEVEGKRLRVTIELLDD